MPFIYLASPYTSPKAAIREVRHSKAEHTVALLLRKNIHVYSPIVHCHELAIKYGLPKDFAFWQSYNRSMLSEASGLWILQIEGWKDSQGVKWEIKFALERNLTIKYISYPLKDRDFQ